MTYIAYYVSAVLFFPIQIILGIVLMYLIIGVSFIGGIGIIVVIGIINFVISKIGRILNEKLMKKKDARMKKTK